MVSLSCRACCCVAEESSLEEFFEMDKRCYFSQNDHTLREVFNSCIPYLEIKPDDGLPQYICCYCVKDLEVVHIFIQKVLKSNDEFTKFKILENEDKCGGPSVKDPLEDVKYEEIKKSNQYILYENADDNRNSFLSIPQYNDNDDNRFEDFSQVGPLIASSPSDCDNNDSDFLISVESQIFPQGRFKCNLCEKTYFTNRGLEAHMEIHTPKSKINSKESTKTPSNDKRRKKRNKMVCDNDSDIEVGGEVLDINNHDRKKMHKDSQPKPKKMFPCQVCGKQMISASKLRYHMVMHTGEKDYLCTMCPKAYSTIYALKHHMRAHTGERPYECKFCGDRFLRPTTLKSHMRRHTGERPYGCDICGKRFIQHSSMATHMKLNHMDKSISCPYCDKKYARQTDLNTHLLSHSGDKPFACKLCPSRFTRQSNLNKHMNQQHHPQSGTGETTMDNIKNLITNEEYIVPYTKNSITSSSENTIHPIQPLIGESTQKSSASNSTLTSTGILSSHSDFEKLISPNNWSWRPNQT